jgi:hypothetical protein
LHFSLNRRNVQTKSMKTNASPSFIRVNQKGQTLMVAVLILSVLCISVPVIVSVQRQGAKTQYDTQQSNTYVGSSREAINYAATKFSDQTIWTNALAGAMPSICGGQIVPAGGGAYYSFICTTGTYGLRNYQVEVKATSYVKTKKNIYIPQDSSKGILSNFTQGVILPDGLVAHAATVLGQPPVGVYSQTSFHFSPNWGPMVVLSTQTMNLLANYTLDYQRAPRKFSQGAITGHHYVRSADSTPPTTDNKEYWAYANMGTMPSIDLATYATMAKNTQFPWTPASLNGNPQNIVNDPPGSGYFQVLNGDTALFHSTYTFNSSTSVIFVDGNAQIGQTGGGLPPFFQLGNSGGFIVTGNMVMEGINPNFYVGVAKNAPDHALEDPYGTYYDSTCGPWGGAACWFYGLQMRGFLYVKGDATYKTTHYHVGVLRVDGQVKSQNTKIYFDDYINHNIRVTPFRVVVNSVVPIANP